MMMEYSKQVKALGIALFELLSEALGLKPNHLVNMDRAKGHALLSHYYPACPEPDLTMGTTKHSDPDFLTILLQDHIGGLQVYYRDQSVDVLPVAGALVVNIGDLLQSSFDPVPTYVSKDIFKSVWHRVLENRVGPRLSVACYFTLHLYPTTRMYGPIKEILLEDGTPALYRETSLCEFITYNDSKGLDGTSALTHFRMKEDGMIRTVLIFEGIAVDRYMPLCTQMYVDRFVMADITISSAASNTDTI
ncbi:1-aminocyclopropane-1-carboxylate oxidase homolog 1-like [Syzygium oleosum]|uniref:1-aminocyclopropane-1-carboxylate oxidase homolog 1-like n=1 Tax=Syzygium oleosum TaxID=219896 RepID=UPI0011D2466E|nr:1-aminocyclopropane-1-carboxylate oxidase homolog 1-like [Syzygium oleosum]